MKALNARDLLSIGELSRRTGLSVSAIRFYESKGLIEPLRTNGNQRRFQRADIRRLSFIMITQRLGLSLRAIEAELSRLPKGRNPTAKDWRRISKTIRHQIDTQIALLERSRERLDDCIGCGCLSLRSCALYNPQDKAGADGKGPRYVLDE